MIGIVILNYKTWEETIECVESIRKSTKCRYKIYIVDNKSPDDSYIQLYSKFQDSDDVVLINSNENGGYSAGNNIGIKQALLDGAEAVILSNSDIIYFENSIDFMYEYLKSNKNIGILGPKVILENNTIQNSPRKNYTFKNYLFSKKPFIFLDFQGIKRKTYFTDYDYDRELVFKGLVSGCCMVLTKEYFELCGFLDENVFLYFEEAIVSNKAINTELKTCVLPQANVLHKGSVSIGKQSAFSRFHRYYSSLYMLRKYVGINKLQFTFILFLNYIPFVINSFYKKEYRRMLKKFTKQCFSLYR
ncbi:glycosyltransferase family 2 protein [Neobacillus drentensis]|uniref:glycosyltransferase family 2 protein n=1 Tax=Neobacillus drentensis TaxID=220684 RepID=UPI001F1BCD7F|nr:glycosyltransferase family 2 protein [Neobacillus drentensis]ULT56778.1 glycosyltransferase family 2 protein [Neobacillus drentensis]